VLVHGSLSAFGYLVGGAQTLYLGLRSLLGVGGTVVAPSFTPQLCHPSAWREPSLAAYAERALDSVPAFDPWLTPASPAMGVLPELVRALPGSRRSSHPHASFVAEGRRAAQITARHRLGYRLSDTSPLGALWDLDASILMLGTGWKSCTALHLAEYAAPYPGRRVGLWPVPQTGPARDPRPTGWLYVPELLCWDGDFELLGAAYERSGEPLSAVSIGDARCLLVPLRPLVRFAAGWLVEHRDLRGASARPGWQEIREHSGALPAPDLARPPAPEPPSGPVPEPPSDRAPEPPSDPASALILPRRAHALSAQAAFTA
jgi:aminoglycoside 3-N-acetyltransferase